jgi:hypothetical protein
MVGQQGRSPLHMAARAMRKEVMELFFVVKVSFSRSTNRPREPYPMVVLFPFAAGLTPRRADRLGRSTRHVPSSAGSHRAGSRVEYGVRSRSYRRYLTTQVGTCTRLPRAFWVEGIARQLLYMYMTKDTRWRFDISGQCEGIRCGQC